MPRRDNRTRLGYMAFVLGWLGYASVISASPLQLTSTPLFLEFKVESNLVLMVDDSDSMNYEIITEDFANDGRYTSVKRDGTQIEKPDGTVNEKKSEPPFARGRVKHRDNDNDGQRDCRFDAPFQSFNLTDSPQLAAGLPYKGKSLRNRGFSS